MRALFIPFMAILAGSLLPFAFAPAGFYPLAVISLFFLLLLWRNTKTPRTARIYGFFYGLGVFATGVSWVYISIHTYGGTNSLLAAVITGFFVMTLSIFPALTGEVLQRFFDTQQVHTWLLTFPALWALNEWTRSWIFSGFPWLLLGQSQTNSPLHGFLPIVGVYGVTFFVALSAGLLLLIFHFKKPVIGLIGLIMIWASGEALSHVSWTKPIGNPVKVSLVQGDIPQSLKWSPEQALKSLTLYQTLSQQQRDSQLILWPESAITIPLPEAFNLVNTLDQKTTQQGTAIITGIPVPEDEKQNSYLNGAIVLGNGSGYYFKRHLVPFGEYVPLEKLLRGFIAFFDLPMSGFVPGPFQQNTMTAAHLNIAPFICYEVAYPYLIRSNLPQANLLITLSNDTWFDHSAALAQHRQIAQVAAQLSGRYMLVATNSGETVIINPQGKITASTKNDETTVLNGIAQGMQGNTPWAFIGDTPFILICIGIVLFIKRLSTFVSRK